MPTKISVYVDEDLHRALETAASLRGMTLSQFMIHAAERALHPPNREVAASKMDSIRRRVRGHFTPDEVRAMRDEARRH